MPRVYTKKPMSERLSKYVIDPSTGCWNWTGSKDKDGYGRMISGSKVNEFLVLRIARAINCTKEKLVYLIPLQGAFCIHVIIRLALTQIIYI